MSFDYLLQQIYLYKSATDSQTYSCYRFMPHMQPSTSYHCNPHCRMALLLYESSRNSLYGSDQTLIRSVNSSFPMYAAPYLVHRLHHSPGMVARRLQSIIIIGFSGFPFYRWLYLLCLFFCPTTQYSHGPATRLFVAFWRLQRD